MFVTFSKKQKLYIKDKILDAKETAKTLQTSYNEDSHCYRLYLLGALKSVLSDLCDESSFDLFEED